MTSSGQALSDREALEHHLGSYIDEQVARFLLATETDALDALDSPVLLAAGNPFARMRLISRWSHLVGRVIDRLSGKVDVPDAYLVAAKMRMLDSPIPNKAYEAASEVLTTTMREGRDPGTTRHLLIDALSFDEQFAPSARRIARTESTGAYGEQAMRLIDSPNKRWVSRLDEHTRPTHLEASGQVVPKDSPFVVGGWPLRAPGDPHAPLSETANCRCVLVADWTEMSRSR